MALNRPQTKAQQATQHPNAGQTAVQSSTTGQGITLGSALDRWYSELAAEGRSAKTLTIYRYGTDRLVNALKHERPLAEVAPEHITSLIAEARAAGLSDATVSAIYRPLRTFGLWCVAAGLLDRSPVTLKPPKVSVGVVPDLTQAQWAAVLATTDSRSRWAFRARRDRALLLMLWTTGCRLSELAGLTLADVDMAAATILVHGKGGKDRVLPLLPVALAALGAYLTHERPRSPHSGLTNALWLTGKGPLRANGIAQLVRARGEQAGVPGLHPHRFRHAFVGRCLAGGMSDALVMALTGHSTHSMLQRYGQANRAQSAMDALRALAG